MQRRRFSREFKIEAVGDRRRLPSAFGQTKPALNFQMRGKLNFQTRWGFRLEYGYLLNKISALTLAGAGGIEPPNGGIKIRCLTAWLRPNGPVGVVATDAAANVPFGHAGL